MSETSRVTFTITDGNGNGIETPVTYGIDSIGVDVNGNIVFKISEKIPGDKRFFITFQGTDLEHVLKGMETATRSVDDISLQMNEDLDWFVFYYPKTSIQENEIWLCELSTISRSGESISIKFDWMHYGLERELVMPEIEKFSKSDVMDSLVHSLEIAAEVHKKSPQSGMKKAMQQLSAQFNNRIDISEFKVDRMEIAKKAGGFSEFGKYMMKEHPVPCKIIMTMDAVVATGIMKKLERCKKGEQLIRESILPHGN